MIITFEGIQVIPRTTKDIIRISILNQGLELFRQSFNKDLIKDHIGININTKDYIKGKDRKNRNQKLQNQLTLEKETPVLRRF